MPQGLAAPEQVLLEDSSGAVRSLILNRPQRKNALNPELLQALAAGLERAAQDASCRVIVIRGEGGSFCSGADLADLDAEVDFETRLDAFHAVILAIHRAPQPVLASVSGPAVGFGADLAFSCDMRFVSSEAYFDESFIKVGLMPDGGGSFWLPRLLGPARAFQMMTLSTRVSAAESVRLGISAEEVPSDELKARTNELAERLSLLAPLALGAIKRTLRRAQDGELEAALQRERESQLRLLRSADFREGVAAFLEKRSPRFQGK